MRGKRQGGPSGRATIPDMVGEEVSTPGRSRLRMNEFDGKIQFASHCPVAFISSVDNWPA